MNIKKIAIATLAPAAVAGVACAGWAAEASSVPAWASGLARTHQAGRAALPHDPAPHRATAAKASAGSHPVKVRAHRHQHPEHPARGRRRPAERSRPAVVTPAPLTAGMSAFAQCVALRESGDNPHVGPAGLFGILPATWTSLGFPGTAGQATVAMQRAAFARLYAADGTAPWAPYDGC